MPVCQPHDYPVGSGGCFPANDLAIGRWLLERSEAEEGLERGHRRASPVVAEDELVEIDVQVVGRDAAVSALKPGLQVGTRPVSTRQELLGVWVVAPPPAGSVVKANAGQLAVAVPAVGMDDRAAFDARPDPGSERGLAGVGSTCRRSLPEP